MNLLSVRWIGLYGILLSTVLSLVCVYTPYGSLVLFERYFQSRQEYFRYLRKTAWYFIVMCLTASATYLLCRPLPGDGIPLLLERFAVCCVAPNAILYAFHRNAPDFKSAKAFVLNIIVKNHTFL